MQTPEQRRAYYLANREKQLEQSKQRYLKNKKALLQYQKEYRTQNKEKVRQRVRETRVNRWKEAISLLGGCCSRCKQVFDPCVYDFHHINPQEKEFTIGENMLISKEKLFTEIKKCILVCANCHRLIHKEYLNVS